jgi:hypothetical protein
MNYFDLKRRFLVPDWFYSFREQVNFREGTVYKKFGDWPRPEQYYEINRIVFSIHSGDIIHNKISLPYFIKELTNLYALTIPIDWLNELGQNIPQTIKALRLTSPINEIDGQYIWPINLIFPYLKYIEIPELIKPFKIDSFKYFPSIEWI